MNGLAEVRINRYLPTGKEQLALEREHKKRPAIKIPAFFYEMRTLASKASANHSPCAVIEAITRSPDDPLRIP